MELRRALLLFAIVLGLAAIATSVSRPRDDKDEPAPARPTTSTPAASPGPEPATPAEITFTPAARPPTKKLEAGRPATLIVEVDEPGQVEIEGLGLTASAEPLTPARFDVLTSDEESHRILLRPAGGPEPRTIGTLVIGAGR